MKTGEKLSFFWFGLCAIIAVYTAIRTDGWGSWMAAALYVLMMGVVWFLSAKRKQDIAKMKKLREDYAAWRNDPNNWSV
jgi:hypothetical protein